MTYAARHSLNFCHYLEDLYVIAKYYIGEINLLLDGDAQIIKRGIKIVYGLFEDKQLKASEVAQNAKTMINSIVEDILEDLDIFFSSSTLEQTVQQNEDLLVNFLVKVSQKKYNGKICLRASQLSIIFFMLF